MTSEQERRLLLLSSIEELGGLASKEKVLDLIESRGWIKLSEYDLQSRRSRNELNWRSDLSFVRDHLRRDGHLGDAWNRWEITESGRTHMRSLSEAAARQREFSHIRMDALSSVLSAAARMTTSDDSALSGETVRTEGSKAQRWTTTYERSKSLREAAVALHGVVCMGCGFEFGLRYGALGRGFIEVHHLKPVSASDGPTQVNVSTDLIVLCSNCHSIVHRPNGPPLELSALRTLVNANK